MCSPAELAIWGSIQMTRLTVRAWPSSLIKGTLARLTPSRFWRPSLGYKYPSDGLQNRLGVRRAKVPFIKLEGQARTVRRVIWIDPQIASSAGLHMKDYLG